ncbi:NAD-specific glutamate dehydrogenase [Candidatus Arcanobacter lacustris]|uniref:NAD-specific glutamate dehydrogenase n=1 Tax=Candidatus Arcanibacter lacustris TaxID=1607817 RepID=A0A0F5MMK7_9RICK|nr:NAD-specific glutamate dehydrogenase [Candidatus Arcanobacter lacustris]
MNITIKKVKKFQDDSMKITSDIIADAKNAGIIVDDILKSFIKEFYALILIEKLEHKNNQYLINMAKESFDFFSSREGMLPKIRIFDHMEEKYTIIETLTDNMPFLLDSLKEELERREIKIHEIIHPILNVKRNDQGDLIAIDDDVKKTNNKESFIRLHISKIKQETKIRELELILTDVVSNVTYAVQDWQEMTNKANELISYPKTHHQTKELLTWVNNNNFTFLGYAQYHFDRNKAIGDKENLLGILKLINIKSNKKISQEIDKFVTNIFQDSNHESQIEICKINLASPVHRNSNIDCIALKTYNDKGDNTGIKIFIGIFTSVLYYQTINSIPIIKDKAKYVMDKAGFLDSSYSSKELSTILQSLPREELFQINQDQLYEMALSIYSLVIKPELKLFVRTHEFDDSLSCLVMIPRYRDGLEIKENISEILNKHLGEGSVITQEIQTNHLPMNCLYTIFTPKHTIDLNDRIITIMEEELKKIVKFWKEDLRSFLDDHLDQSQAKKIHKKYKNAFPIAYKENFPVDERVLKDIRLIELALTKKFPIFELHQDNKDVENDNFILSIYSYDRKILLSEMMPIFDHMGFSAVDEDTYCVNAVGHDGILWLHNFHLNISSYHVKSITELKEYEILAASEIKRYIEEALMQIWCKNLQNDYFNTLIIRARLDWRQVLLIRTLAKYIRQTGFTYSSEYVESIVISHPRLAKLIFMLFNQLFSPSENNKDQNKLDAINHEIATRLNQVVSSAEDKIIRRFFEVVRAIVRTNYYQTDSEGNLKDYVSIKINSSLVPELPKPVPFREIFVYSTKVEGIHLRGGSVARGGLRWSDRSEDFRTEVLGLMKAQMTKNSVIIPVGSKGGFVVKQSMPLIGRDEYLKEGIRCYETFLRGLLDVTDNIIDGKIVNPKNVIRYDDNDPYLVVAADKGTASFSDIANRVAASYNFWLGDAFASGGALGYDHKKMAITARGGWISVERHFNDLGINIKSQDFTVIGIGDMSGDVFGNAMLLSKNIRLVAAFNHMHIFIDPNPDSKTSFNERDRLFNMAVSGWSDYNPALISKGGGVFDRKAKTIDISPEIKQLLDIKEDQLSPDDLIKKILQARVDLLWNGGIGTYVKQSGESNAQVGDKTNDGLRINGSDLRCKIVGEGGNIGFTQLGRIEYARNGGRINTDAIDNSAGVDCSDHEVNIKIALFAALSKNKITTSQRDKLLAQMTDEVASLVLMDNKLQTQAITIAEQQGSSVLEMNARLINKLESANILNREVEFLPSNPELAKLESASLGLTRPEIAILLAYSKITIFNELLASDLPEDPYCKNDLISYFPKAMQENFVDEIENHRLRREIIATSIANSMVNRVGTFFYNFVQEDTAMPGSDIARSYIIARESLMLKAIWQEIEELDGKIDTKYQVELFTNINKLLSRFVLWLLKKQAHNLNIEQNINILKLSMNELIDNIEFVINGSSHEKYLDKLNYYKGLSISETLAKKMAAFSILSPAFDIIELAHKTKLPILKVAKLYFELGSRFSFDRLRLATDKIVMNNYWERLSLNSLKDDLYDQQRALALDVIKKVGINNNSINEWCLANEKRVNAYDVFIKDLSLVESLDFPMVVVATKKLNLLIL